MLRKMRCITVLLAIAAAFLTLTFTVACCTCCNQTGDTGDDTSDDSDTAAPTTQADTSATDTATDDTVAEPTNNDPQISGVEAVTVKAGYSSIKSLTGKCTDPDGDATSWAAEEYDTSLIDVTIIGTNMRVKPTETASGDASFILRCTDAQGASATTTVSVTVTAKETTTTTSTTTSAGTVTDSTTADETADAADTTS